MAIDKVLPNIRRTRRSVSLKPEQVAVENLKDQLKKQEMMQPPVDIKKTEDGGVEIDFDPREVISEDGQNHNANLAEYLEDADLNEISSELRQQYYDYKGSRKDWEDGYIKGLDLLGFKYEGRTEPFQGASGATHPVLAEAVTQFQALAYKELLPASGPVRTQVVGKVNEQRQQQAERVKDFMNYQIMIEMKEYEPEFDQMLFNLPLAGSTFKKVYYDVVLGRTVSKFVPAEDLVIPYNATSLDDADAIMHVIRVSENDLRKQQLTGFYADIELGSAASKQDDVLDKKNELEGVSTTNGSDLFTLIECHVNLDIPGFEDLDPETQEPTG